MKRIRVALLGGLLVACLVGAGLAHAAEPEGAQSPDRVDEVLVRYNFHPAFEKLGRGLGNVAGGWLEIPWNLQTRYVPADAATSFFTGLVWGLVKGVARTGVGVYETVTFWLPYPEEFAPILPTLPYFKKDEVRKQPLLLE